MSRLARLRNPHAVAVVALVVLVAFPIVRPDTVYYQSVLLLAFLLGIQAVSWNVISGYAGYVSLGHSVFLGIGAYTAAILSALRNATGRELNRVPVKPDDIVGL